MRRKIITGICFILAFLLGSGSILYLVYKYPNEVVKTITEKNITVTENSISEVVEEVEDAVVTIESYYKETLIGSGSGFAYDKNDMSAYIMTNHHVIANADKIMVTFNDGSEVQASLVGSDEYADIAVLKIDLDKVLSLVTIGSSEDLKVGDTVFAIGSPVGKEYAGTVTKGILSGKDRLVSVSISGSTNDWIMSVMQTDAAINPGNSGGPLFNINGEVIGINSMKIVQTTIEGIGFAIPIEDAITYAKQIIEDGKISRPYIGISMLNASNIFQLAYSGIRLDEDITEGIVVMSVSENSPAQEAGLERGDVIIKVGKYEVKDLAEFRYRLYNHEIGETIKLTIIRDGKEKEVEVTLKGN